MNDGVGTGEDRIDVQLLPFDSLRSLRAIRLRLTLDVLEEWPAMSGAERSEAESNGSRGRTRTFNPTVNSRVLYH